MKKTKTNDILINNLRMWGENPRYTENSKITINNIGLRDFQILDDQITNDNYWENYSQYVEKLLINLDSIKVTVDLVESMTKGFDSELDDIFVAQPKALFSFLDYNYKYVETLYYVVEGNRRLLAIDLLKNNNNSREIILNIIKKIEQKEINNINKIMISNLKKILAICEKYDLHPTISDIIECKVLDYNYFTTSEGSSHLNKILNSRHFGQRKGKLNWPRGLILKKIYKLTEMEIKKNPDIESSILYHNIENLIGKKITSSDINNAIFVNQCIEQWNMNHDSKIKWEDSETGDINEIINTQIIQDETGEILTETEDYVDIYVSSIENSKSNIQILDDNFILKKLSEILSFNIDFRKIGTDSSIEVTNKQTRKKMDLENTKILLLYIIEGVKLGEVKTRLRNNITETSKKIRSLLFPIEFSPLNKALNLTINQLSNLNIEDQYLNIEEKEKLRIIISNLNKIINLYEENIEDINQKDVENDLILSTLKYIWINEYGKFIKFKDKSKVIDIPTIIFSSLYRTTCEFISHIIHKSILLDYIENLASNYNPKDAYHNKAKTLFEVFNKTTKNYFVNNSIDICSNYANASILKKEQIIFEINLIYLYFIGLINEEELDNVVWINFDRTKVVDFENTKNLFFKPDFNSFKLIFNNDIIETEADFNLIKMEIENKYDFEKLLPNQKNLLFTLLFEFKFKELSDSDGNLILIKNIINRIIHKPLFALNIYKNANKINLLTAALEFIMHIEQIILKILNNN